MVYFYYLSILNQFPPIFIYSNCSLPKKATFSHKTAALAGTSVRYAYHTLVSVSVSVSLCQIGIFIALSHGKFSVLSALWPVAFELVCRTQV